MSPGRWLRFVVMLATAVLASLLMPSSAGVAGEHAASWSAVDASGHDAPLDHLSSPDATPATGGSGDAALGVVAWAYQSVELEHTCEYRCDFARPPPVEVGFRSENASDHNRLTAHHPGRLHRALLSVEARAVAPNTSGDTLYRGLHPGENPRAGLSARNPNASITPSQHVFGTRDSQWISTTKSPDVARDKFGENGWVAIDRSQVTGPTVDGSAGVPAHVPGHNCMFCNSARADQEVLIQGAPPGAVTRMDN